jgi:hypothetical protein
MAQEEHQKKEKLEENSPTMKIEAWTEWTTYVGYGDVGSSCKARCEERQKILHDGEAAAQTATAVVQQPVRARARMQQLQNVSQGSSVYKETYGRRRYAISHEN